MPGLSWPRRPMRTMLVLHSVGVAERAKQLKQRVSVYAKAYSCATNVELRAAIILCLQDFPRVVAARMSTLGPMEPMEPRKTAIALLLRGATIIILALRPEIKTVFWAVIIRNNDNRPSGEA